MPLKLHQEQPSPIGTGQIKSIVAIAAGKGGVGKSTVTVQLAQALKRKGLSLGILDIDLYGPSLRKMLPEDRLPIQKGEQIVPALCSGIKMISMAYFRKTQEASIVRAPIANSIVSQFLKQVEWGSLDLLLVDFPPGTGDIQLTLTQQVMVTGAILVTTPQQVAVQDVRKAMHMFNQVKVPILGLVENMSYFLDQKTYEKQFLFGCGGGTLLSQETGVPLLAQIPIDPEISEVGDRGLAVRTPGLIHLFDELASDLLSHLNALQLDSQGILSHFELVWKELES